MKLSDWDCSGTLTPIDAAITLGIIVGRIHFEDTPLVQGCGVGGGAATVFAPARIGGGAGAAAEPSELEVSDVSGRPGDVVTVEVRTRQALALGSTGLALSYDRLALEPLNASSDALTGFTWGIDAQRGLVRTASATGEEDVLAAGATLFRVTFRVRGDVRRPISALDIVGGDGRSGATLAGPVRERRMPETIAFTATGGRVRVGAARRTGGGLARR